MNIGLRFGAPEKEAVGINKMIKEAVGNTLRIDKGNQYLAMEQNYLGFPIKDVSRLAKIDRYIFKATGIFGLKVNGMLGKKLDLVHSYFNPMLEDTPYPKIMTVHDIIAFVHPEWNRPAAGAFRTVIRESAEKANMVIADSEWTKRDLVEYYRLSPEKIHVVYLGTDSALDYSNKEDTTTRKYGLEEGYILSVCTLEPRKNLRGLIEGFVIYKKENPASKLKLVLTGKVGWDDDFKRFLKEQGSYAGDIVLTGYVPDDELSSLYLHAVAFAYVSFYEGFGLPVLEAMAAGRAVVCSDQTCMPEVGGDAVEYCNPYKKESISEAIWRVVDDESHRRELEERALIQAGKFSYQKTAEETIRIYETFV